MFWYTPDEQAIDVDETEQRFLDEGRPHIELGRTTDPKEVATVIPFLASKAASFVTGANYRVDGGSVARIDT